MLILVASSRYGFETIYTIVGVEGIEPPTYAGYLIYSQARTIAALLPFCCPYEVRTRDLLINNQVLYRLS